MIIANHDATVLPFRDALLRAPRETAAHVTAAAPRIPDGELRDNVIVLARFSARRAHRRHRLGGPPEGDAA